MTALLGLCCLTYDLASVLKFWLHLKLQHFSSNLMTLEALIEAQGTVGLSGCCGLSGCWHPASVTFPSDFHAPLFPSVCHCSPEPWRVLFPIQSGRGEHLCALEGTGGMPLISMDLLCFAPKAFSSSPCTVPLFQGSPSEPSCSRPCLLPGFLSSLQ